MTRRHASRDVRLIPLEAAQKLLGGHHPIILGIGEALPGVFDVRAIHAALDRKSQLVVEVSGSPSIQVIANDDDADPELAELEKRIAARAARRP